MHGPSFEDKLGLSLERKPAKIVQREEKGIQIGG